MDGTWWNGAPGAEHDPDAGGAGVPYICRACAWTGRGAEAAHHARDTGHAVRGRDWPASWPDAVISVPARTARRSA